MNPAYFGCSEKDKFRFFFRKKFTHCGLVGQIQFRMGTRYDVAVALRSQIAHERRADEAAMSCNIKF